MDWLNWARHAHANLAIMCGTSSGILIVDIDCKDGGDPDARLRLVEDNCGRSPLVERTPSGGYHVWYRFNGERSVQGKQYAGTEWYSGQPIDILGTGRIAIVTPSVNRRKGNYACIRGRIDKETIDALQFVTPGSISRDEVEPAALEGKLKPGDGRNSALLCALKDFACSTPIKDEDAGMQVVRELEKNISSEPLSDHECRGIVRRILRWQADDSLYPKGTAFAKLDELRYLRLRELAGSDWQTRTLAVDIWAWALMSLGHSSDPFPLSPKGLGSTLRVSPRPIARAVRLLEQTKIVECVTRGGHGPGDPNLYTWATKVSGRTEQK